MSLSRQAVEAPPATPPVYSLLDAVKIPSDSVRWEQGIVWSPEQIGGGGVVALNCHGGTDELGTGVNPVRNTADPFVVWAEDHCSTIGFDDRDFEGRARRQLAAVQSAKIAHELQMGVLRDSDANNDNVALIDGIEVGPGGAEVEDGIAALEAAVAARYAGARAMIHVTPQTLTIMGRLNMIYKAGQQWLTYPGNVVVADAGYTAEAGENPPDAGVFAYATTMIEVRLSAVTVGNFRESMNRATNSVQLYAQRLALVQFDHTAVNPADLIFKVELELPPWHLGS